MKTVSISLNSVDKVESFVKAVDRFDFEIDIVSESRVLDAKSIIGIFSTDLSKPLRLDIHASDEDAEKVMHVLKPYLT